MKKYLSLSILLLAGSLVAQTSTNLPFPLSSRLFVTTNKCGSPILKSSVPFTAPALSGYPIGQLYLAISNIADKIAAGYGGPTSGVSSNTAWSIAFSTAQAIIANNPSNWINASAIAGKVDQFNGYSTNQNLNNPYLQIGDGFMTLFDVYGKLNTSALSTNVVVVTGAKTNGQPVVWDEGQGKWVQTNMLFSPVFYADDLGNSGFAWRPALTVASDQGRMQVIVSEVQPDTGEGEDDGWRTNFLWFEQGAGMRTMRYNFYSSPTKFEQFAYFSDVTNIYNALGGGSGDSTNGINTVLTNFIAQQQATNAQKLDTNGHFVGTAPYTIITNAPWLTNAGNLGDWWTNPPTGPVNGGNQPWTNVQSLTSTGAVSAGTLAMANADVVSGASMPVLSLYGTTIQKMQGVSIGNFGSTASLTIVPTTGPTNEALMMVQTNKSDAIKTALGYTPQTNLTQLGTSNATVKLMLQNGTNVYALEMGANMTASVTATSIVINAASGSGSSFPPGNQMNTNGGTMNLNTNTVVNSLAVTAGITNRGGMVIGNPANVVAGGDNAAGFVYTETGGTANSGGAGSLVHGQASAGGVISGGSSGALISGLASGTNSTLLANGNGSVVNGKADAGGTIFAETDGDYAGGEASDGGTIEATDEGSFAYGRTTGSNSLLKANAEATFVLGHAEAGGVLQAAFNGSLIGGSANGTTNTTTEEGQFKWVGNAVITGTNTAKRFEGDGGGLTNLFGSETLVTNVNISGDGNPQYFTNTTTFDYEYSLLGQSRNDNPTQLIVTNADGFDYPVEIGLSDETSGVAFTFAPMVQVRLHAGERFSLTGSGGDSPVRITRRRF